MGMKRN